VNRILFAPNTNCLIHQTTGGFL